MRLGRNLFLVNFIFFSKLSKKFLPLGLNVGLGPFGLFSAFPDFLVLLSPGIGLFSKHLNKLNFLKFSCLSVYEFDFFITIDTVTQNI